MWEDSYELGKLSASFLKVAGNIRSPQTRGNTSDSPDGEVAGLREGARLEPSVHTLFPHRQRRYRASGSPATIVRRQPDFHEAASIASGMRTWKTRIGKRSHWNGHDFRLRVKRIPDCRTTVGAKAKTDLATLVTHSGEDVRLSSDLHRGRAKARLRSEHAPGAPLTFQAMADGNSHRLCGGCGDELSACTASASGGHG